MSNNPFLSPIIAQAMNNNPFSNRFVEPELENEENQLGLRFFPIRPSYGRQSTTLQTFLDENTFEESELNARNLSYDSDFEISVQRDLAALNRIFANADDDNNSETSSSTEIDTDYIGSDEESFEVGDELSYVDEHYFSLDSESESQYGSAEEEQEEYVVVDAEEEDVLDDIFSETGDTIGLSRLVYQSRGSESHHLNRLRNIPFETDMNGFLSFLSDGQPQSPPIVNEENRDENGNRSRNIISNFPNYDFPRVVDINSGRSISSILSPQALRGRSDILNTFPSSENPPIERQVPNRDHVPTNQLDLMMQDIDGMANDIYTSGRISAGQENNNTLTLGGLRQVFSNTRVFNNETGVNANDENVPTPPEIQNVEPEVTRNEVHYADDEDIDSDDGITIETTISRYVNGNLIYRIHPLGIEVQSIALNHIDVLVEDLMITFEDYARERIANLSLRQVIIIPVLTINYLIGSVVFGANNVWFTISCVSLLANSF
ncbi:hypothetical protein DFJ63DRAFT_336996 [Scheffersomyces coipomensis]|uniref:uncharacterized protein n=1 Tax=Scheffersomyces coipomensis TaxID=1788519 RepID=UPI00315CC815